MVANKCENDNLESSSCYNEIFKLGFKETLFVSAEHGDGTQEILKAIEGLNDPNAKEIYSELKTKRKQRFGSLKIQLKLEIEELIKE